MSFRPSDYHPKWSLISRLIRVHRAGNHCEKCGVPNHTVIVRSRGGHYRPVINEEHERLQALARLPQWKMRRALKYLKFTKVALAVAHLDRNRFHNRFNNLMALCQYCHLTHDLPQHIRNRQFGRHHDREHQLQFFNNHKKIKQYENLHSLGINRR